MRTLLEKLRGAVRDLRAGPGPLTDRVERNSGALLLAVLALALVLRLGFLAVFHEELESRNDKGFTHPALNLIAGHGFGLAADCPTAYRAPLYVLFVSVFHGLFGDRGYAWPLGLAQVLFSVFNVFLVYLIGKEWRSKRVGLLAALVMAVYPYNLYHDVQYYITFLFTCFVLLATYGFLVLERTRRWQVAGLTGAALGMAMLATSGPMIFFAPLACLWLWRRWGSFRAALKYGLIAAGFAALVLSPWWVRNYRAFGEFVPFTTDGGRIFYKNYNPYALQMMLHGIMHDATPEPGEGVQTPFGGIGKVGCGFLGMSEPDNDRYWYGKAAAWTRENPEQVPVLLGTKFLYLWRPWLNTPRGAVGDTGSIILSAAATNWGYALSYGFILTFGLFEWVAGRRERGRTGLFLFLALAFTITYTLTAALTKYRVPFDSALAVLAAGGVWRFAEAYLAYRGRRKRD
jgi:4-amino-4-deoxy-L-arabinose transferase-like glycosyltransferase